jgi:hypothetical protein
MKTRYIYSTLLIAIGTCLFVLGFSGCATPRTVADKPTIETLGGIGVFVWRGLPICTRTDATGGVLGGGSDLGMSLVDTVTGERQKTRQTIYDSAVYDTFKHNLAQKFAEVSKVPVRVLNESKYVFSGTGHHRRVDVVATSKAEGYDAILEAVVWPYLHERLGNDHRFHQANKLEIELKLRRVTDSKVLWRESYTVGSADFNSQFRDWNELACEAADCAIQKYNTLGN